LVTLAALLTAVPGRGSAPPARAHTDVAVGPRPTSHEAVPVAQTAVTDAGSFTVLQAGAKVGREVFTIRKAPPPDAGYLTEGSVVFSTRRLVPALRTDSTGAPLRYDLDEFASDRRQRQLTLQIARGRGTEHVQTGRGESGTEFMVGPDARLLDDDVFAQYYFIARSIVRSDPHDAGQRRVVSVLIPRRGGTVVAAVTVVGDERLDIGGQTRPAIHIRIELAADDVRDIWADAEGRVLRIAIPARRLVALRDDVPA
jgi:hypothetical protein